MGLSDRVSPREMVDWAQTRTLTAFLAQYGDAPFLIVRVPPDQVGFLATLEATLPIGTIAPPARPSVQAMEFHTVVHSAATLRSTASTNEERAGERVAAWLASEQHYLVPIRKREASDGFSSARISVGRAPNKDIVFRHESVSKSHCWFEFEEGGSLLLADAGSKNATFRSGERLPPKQLVPVLPGDTVRMGSVETLVAPAAVLYAALRRAALAP